MAASSASASAAAAKGRSCARAAEHAGAHSRRQRAHLPRRSDHAPAVPSRTPATCSAALALGAVTRRSSFTDRGCTECRGASRRGAVARALCAARPLVGRLAAMRRRGRRRAMRAFVRRSFSAYAKARASAAPEVVAHSSPRAAAQVATARGRRPRGSDRPHRRRIASGTRHRRRRIARALAIARRPRLARLLWRGSLRGEPLARPGSTCGLRASVVCGARRRGRGKRRPNALGSRRRREAAVFVSAPSMTLPPYVNALLWRSCLSRSSCAAARTTIQPGRGLPASPRCAARQRVAASAYRGLARASACRPVAARRLAAASASRARSTSSSSS